MEAALRRNNLAKSAPKLIKVPYCFIFLNQVFHSGNAVSCLTVSVQHCSVAEASRQRIDWIEKNWMQKRNCLNDFIEVKKLWKRIKDKREKKQKLKWDGNMNVMYDNQHQNSECQNINYHATCICNFQKWRLRRSNCHPKILSDYFFSMQLLMKFILARHYSECFN